MVSQLACYCNTVLEPTLFERIFISFAIYVPEVQCLPEIHVRYEFIFRKEKNKSNEIQISQNSKSEILIEKYLSFVEKENNFLYI